MEDWKQKCLNYLKKTIDNPYVLYAILIVFGLSPILLFIVLWMGLDPVGFWQKAAMLFVLFAIFLPVNIPTAVVAIFGITQVYDEVKKLNIKK